MFQAFSISLMMNQVTDCSRGVGQPAVSCTNTNSLHILQSNGNVSAEVQEFVGNPSTSVETFETT